MCAVAAAKAGEGVPSCVSAAAADRPPREKEVRAGPGGGTAGWGRRRRTLQSPGVARRGRGETYTGPPGPAQRRRRGLRTAPPPPRALALRPASLQVTLAAGEKLQKDGSVRCKASRLWSGSGRNPFPRLLCALTARPTPPPAISEES